MNCNPIYPSSSEWTAYLSLSIPLLPPHRRAAAYHSAPYPPPVANIGTREPRVTSGHSAGFGVLWHWQARDFPVRFGVLRQARDFLVRVLVPHYSGSSRRRIHASMQIVWGLVVLCYTIEAYNNARSLRTWIPDWFSSLPGLARTRASRLFIAMLISRMAVLGHYGLVIGSLPFTT
jgi:hypothetical protein